VLKRARLELGGHVRPRRPKKESLKEPNQKGGVKHVLGLDTVIPKEPKPETGRHLLKLHWAGGGDRD